MKAINGPQPPIRQAGSKREEQVSGIAGDGRMFEAVFDVQRNPSLRFVVREGDELNSQSSIVVSDKIIQPPLSRLGSIERGTVLFPSDAADFGTRSDLLAEIKAYIRRYADVPEFLVEVMAHYVLMSWMFDKYSAVPYLRFQGEPGTGKTRLLQIMQQLCYRGIMFGPGSSVSPLFRLQDTFHGTIIFDEADFSKSDMQSDVVKILNGGYTKGAPVMRSGSSDRNYEAESFDVFGPKVIANRDRFSDRALESRCLTFQTAERPIRPHIPLQLPQAFFAEGAQLRNKLLMWRLTEYDSIQPEESVFAGLNPRQAQIATTLYSVSPDPSFRERFLQHMTEQDAELRTDNPSLLVLDVLSAHSDRGSESVLSKLATSQVRQLAAKREQRAFEFQERRVNALAASLGLSKKRTNAGQSILLDRAKLAEIRGRYGREVLPEDVLEVVVGPTQQSGSGSREGRAAPLAA